MSRNKLMKQNETFDFVIRKCWMSLSKMYNEMVSDHEISVAIGFALLNIDVKEGTPSTALGPKMGMESTSLSRLLKNMEERELIFRESHPSDKRSVLIKLTPNGLKKRNISRAASLEFNEHVLQELGSDDAKSFFQAMATIERVVEQLRLETDIHTSIKN